MDKKREFSGVSFNSTQHVLLWKKKNCSLKQTQENLLPKKLLNLNVQNVLQQQQII